MASCATYPNTTIALCQPCLSWRSERPPNTPLQRRRVDERAAPIAPDDHDLDPNTADSQETPNPMAGVRFASMTGARPSGFRPEHLAAMLKCNRRRAVNRLLCAITETQNLAAAGALPANCWSWIMDPRLVFIAKKSGIVPRPIRVGDLEASHLQTSSPST